MSKAWYERQKQIDPTFLARKAKERRDYCAVMRLNPEWVAKEKAACIKRRQNPERAARYKEASRLYNERIQNDPELRERRNQTARDWRKRHPDRCKKYDFKKLQKRRRNNPLSYILQGAKNTAKAKGLDFNITADDLHIPDVCPILGIPVAPFLGRENPSTASIDRIDPRKGYVRGNVRIISFRANRLKLDCTNATELRYVVADLERIFGN